MFKFRSTLVNQLWRFAQEDFKGSSTSFALHHQEQPSGEEVSQGHDDRRPLYSKRTASTASLEATNLKKKQIRAVLMRLKKSHLEVLLKAVQSKGAEIGGCVMIPNVSRTSSGLKSHILMCQMFRWPDLQSESDLKRLSICQENDESFYEEKSVNNHLGISRTCCRLYECCNPYHWSRRYQHIHTSKYHFLSTKATSSPEFI